MVAEVLRAVVPVEKFEATELKVRGLRGGMVL